MKPILKINYEDSDDLCAFFVAMRKAGIYEKYPASMIVDPVFYFREEFVDYLAKNGFSSLLKHHITCDSIVSPGMSIDVIENTIFEFLKKLIPAKNLLIIDPFLYGKPGVGTCSLFSRLISPFSGHLKKITVISNGQNEINKLPMQNEILKIDCNIAIIDIKTENFHDRFWINPDEKTGVVMGTSLNGIQKKIALVDKLSESDVLEILDHAKAVGFQ